MPRNMKEYVPVSNFLELVEAELSIEASLKTDSAHLLASKAAQYGSKIGYKAFGYLLNRFAGKEGYSEMSAWTWKPAQAKYISELRSIPQWLRDLAGSRLNGYTGDTEEIEVGDISQLQKYYEWLK